LAVIFERGRVGIEMAAMRRRITATIESRPKR
jgi:hypothetical protein